MKMITCHLIFCILLFIDLRHHQQTKLKPFYQFHKTHSWIKKQSQKIKKHIPNPTHQAFLQSLITGKKRALKKTSLYLQIKKAQLMHLLTPSGIHLSSLILPLFWLFKSFFPRLIILLLLGVGIFNQSHLMAAQRMWILKCFLLCKSPIILSFYLVFSLTLFFHSTLSWLLSFMFLGTLIFNPYKQIIPTILLLLIPQILACSYFQNSFYPLAIIINPLITAIMTLIFPFLFLTFFMPQAYFLIKPIMSLMFKIISLISIIPPLIPASIFTAILLLFFLYKPKIKYQVIIFILLIFQPISVI